MAEDGRLPAPAIAMLYNFDNRWRMIWTDGRPLPKVVDGGVEIGGALVGGLVPLEPRLVLLEAGTGVDDQQSTRPFWMAAIKRQRHVAAEGKPADHGALHAQVLEQAGEGRVHGLDDQARVARRPSW